MTTIQIAVVVALVFFAVISVVVLIVWKRETEMRTNSIRFIEDTLVNIRDGLSENNDLVAGELLRMNRENPEVPEVHQDRNDGSYILPALFSDGFFSMVPGEERDIKLHGCPDMGGKYISVEWLNRFRGMSDGRKF